MKPFAVAIQSENVVVITIKTEEGYINMGAGEATPIIATTMGIDQQDAIEKVAVSTEIPIELLVAFELAI